MATSAHCLYCFEVLNAKLNHQDALSLTEVTELWARYQQGREGADAQQASAGLEAVGPRSEQLQTPGAASRSSSSSTGASTASASDASSRSSAVPEAVAVDSKHPLFVTWNVLHDGDDKELRGCIGTFAAQPLEHGLESYALTSALDDTRFRPITPAELPRLGCDVTLLTDFEPAASPMDWEVGRHGIRISFTHDSRRYGSTYLPDVASEQGWGREEALVSLMRKAGWRGRRDAWRDVQDLQVVRYQGLRVGESYGTWRRWRDWVEQQQGRA